MEAVAAKQSHVTRVTCGFILQVDQRILFCKPTGGNTLDLPKGMRDPGESSLAAALRELREETGLILGTDGIRQMDLGLEAYNRYKNLHLFYVRLPEIDVTKLWCESTFETRWGKIAPEVNGYELITLTQAWGRLSKGLKTYLNLKRDRLNIAEWPAEDA